MYKDDCIFCKIGAHKIESTPIYEDDEVLAFNDIDPKAPKHVLIIPKTHLSSLREMTEDDVPLVGKLLFTAKKIALDLGISQNGFRVVINAGEAAGQAVDHLHVHLLGGRSLNWPPG